MTKPAKVRHVADPKVRALKIGPAVDRSSEVGPIVTVQHLARDRDAGHVLYDATVDSHTGTLVIKRNYGPEGGYSAVPATTSQR